MDAVDFIIAELRKGKTYFKPLPYSGVEGGTTITFEATRQRFKEINPAKISRSPHFYVALRRLTAVFLPKRAVEQVQRSVYL